MQSRDTPQQVAMAEATTVLSDRRSGADGRALAQETIAAHGGAEVWEGTEKLVVALRSGGQMMNWKGHRRTMDDVTFTVWTSGQRVTVEPFPTAGQRGIFDGGTVRIESESGETVAERADPRPQFRRLRRQFRWDDLDLLYFSGYAMWTYLSMPFVCLRRGYELRASAERELEVTFPDGVHTHCAAQRFRLDERGLIAEHRYTAEPVGRWARSVHVCSEHRVFGGLAVPTMRRVYPRTLTGGRVPFPVLVRIDISAVSLVPAASNAGCSGQGFRRP
jgi:hypothetical protein